MGHSTALIQYPSAVDDISLTNACVYTKIVCYLHAHKNKLNTTHLQIPSLISV